MNRRLLCLAACALMVPAMLLAQGTDGRLAGTVTDESGKPLTKSAVQIVGTSRGAYTDQSGKYQLVGIRAGSYQVKVSYPGKEPQTRSVRISPDQTTNLDVQLQPKGEVIGIVVTAQRDPKAQQVGTVSTTSGEAIERSARTSNIFQTAVLTAGVSGAGQTGLSIRGGRDVDGSIRMDGQEISDPFMGSVGNSSLALYPTVSTLAVDQVQVVQSGLGAEYGDVLSGVVNTVTRTGSNNKYEGAFRFRTNVPALYGWSDAITVQKAGTNIDTTLPPVRLKSSGNKQYEFAFGGPIPGTDFFTFFFTGKLSMSPRSGGYEVYDMSPEFAASRAGIARESWGFVLEPTNLSDIPHNESMVRNLQGKFKIDVSDAIAIEMSGEIGLSSSERGQWGNLYMFDTSTVTGVLERDAQQINFNTIINRAQLKYRQLLTTEADNASFFDVTGSYLRHISEVGKKDETKEYGIFDTYDIYAPIDDNNDVIIDRYALPEADIRLNALLAEPIPGFGRNPITGLFEGGEIDGASRNPYGLNDLNFPVHGNERALENRSAVEIRLKGGYETNFQLSADLRTQIKAGFEIGQTTLRRHQNNLPWDPNPFFDVYGFDASYFNNDTTNTLRSFFTQPYTPVDGALYVSTRFEYKSIYFTPGVRFDFLSPNAQIPPVKRFDLNQIVNDIDSLGPASLKFQVSPRVGVSYPVTETSQFRVNFAMMFKMPEYNILYDNAYNDASRGNQLFGNPNIEPQKAVVYEMGYSAEIAKDYDVDVAAFYRDVYNQTGITFVPAIPSPYLIYTVTEYGNVRGLTFMARRRLVDNIGLELSYTLQKAVGTASSPAGNYATAIAGVDPYTGERQKLPLVEYPLNYDQTHALAGTLTLSWGEDQGPAIGSLKLLENTDITLTGTFGTGLPYTRENTRGQQISEYNSQRLPSVFSTEGHIERAFMLKDIFGDAAGNLHVSFFADVYNILNLTGPITVRLSRSPGGSRFSISGSPDTDGGALERNTGDFISTPYFKDIDPARPETWETSQYDEFGTRLYNPYADSNLDGIVTQLERYEGYQRFVSTIQSLRGSYQAPRSVAVGVKLRF